MKWLIYGAGALGQALGCMLAAGGHRVDLILRQRFIEDIAEQGLHVDGIFGAYHAPAGLLGLHADTAALPAADHDCVLLTTKAYDTGAAARDLGTLAGLSCPVVSMQNGCGNIEQVAEVFGMERTLGARVITGFEIIRPGRVRVTVSADRVHVGDALPGDISPAAAEIAAAIDLSGLPCEAVADVHMSLFAKLLYNCSLNPLGAILGVPYGALAGHPDTRNIMDRVIEETFAVILAMGGRTPWPDAAAYRRDFYARLVPATADHRPSMLQDIEQGKTTEVEALVGYVGRRGRAFGVATPTCDALAGLVRFRQGRKDGSRG